MKFVWRIVRIILLVILTYLCIKNWTSCLNPVDIGKDGKVTIYSYEDYFFTVEKEIDVEYDELNDADNALIGVQEYTQPERYEAAKDVIEVEYMEDFETFKDFLANKYLSDGFYQKYQNGYSNISEKIDIEEMMFKPLGRTLRLKLNESIEDYIKEKFDDGYVVFATTYGEHKIKHEILGMVQEGDVLNITSKYVYRDPKEDRLAGDTEVIRTKYYFIKPSGKEIEKVNLYNYYHTYNETNKYQWTLTLTIALILYLFVRVYFWVDDIIQGAKRIAKHKMEISIKSLIVKGYKNTKKSIREKRGLSGIDTEETYNKLIDDMDLYVQTMMPDELNEDIKEDDDDDPIKFK